MKPNTFSTALVRPKLVVHDYSHMIFKQKPKIRIIHVVEPEIIKTDVQNFQELVQRLTGKPVVRKGNNTSNMKTSSSQILPYCSIKTESVETQRVKKEIEEIYDAETENVLSSFLGELDGFLHDMNELPLVSINAIW